LPRATKRCKLDGTRNDESDGIRNPENEIFDGTHDGTDGILNPGMEESHIQKNKIDSYDLNDVNAEGLQVLNLDKLRGLLEDDKFNEFQKEQIRSTNCFLICFFWNSLNLSSSNK
jgi:hypothetical protein